MSEDSRGVGVTNPGADHPNAAESGGGDAALQISERHTGTMKGVGVRALRTNRAGNAMEGFECGGRRGSCDYGKGECRCKDGFHGKACEYRGACRNCSPHKTQLEDFYKSNRSFTNVPIVLARRN